MSIRIYVKLEAHLEMKLGRLPEILCRLRHNVSKKFKLYTANILPSNGNVKEDDRILWVVHTLRDHG